MKHKNRGGKGGSFSVLKILYVIIMDGSIISIIAKRGFVVNIPWFLDCVINVIEVVWMPNRMFKH